MVLESASEHGAAEERQKQMVVVSTQKAVE